MPDTILPDVNDQDLMIPETVYYYQRLNHLRDQDQKIVEHLQTFATDYPWQYFFTGTFKSEFKPQTALSKAVEFFQEAQRQESYRPRDSALSYLVFVEGKQPVGRNFLCDERWNKHQGKRIKRVSPRAHVHAVLHFNNDPIITRNNDGPHYLYTDWFEQHGRVMITKIPQLEDCIRYITKYASKTVKTDLWDVSMESFLPKEHRP